MRCIESIYSILGFVLEKVDAWINGNKNDSELENVNYKEE